MSRIRSFDQRTFKARTFLSVGGGAEEEFSAVASAELSVTAEAIGVVGVSGTAAAVVALRATATGTTPSTEIEPVQIVPIGGGSPLLSRRKSRKKKPIVVEGTAAAEISIEVRARGSVGAPPAITGMAKAVVVVTAQMDGNFTNMIPWDNDDLMMLAA